MSKALRVIEPGRALSASKLLRSYLPPEQHEADGCASPASSTGPRGANCACAVPRLAVSSAKEAAKKWALRAPSRAQRRQRRAHGRAPPTMVKASRSELSNPGLRGPNTKRAPGRPVRPYTARCASLRGRPPLKTSAAGRRSAHIQASGPKRAPLVIRTRPVASPRELSHPSLEEPQSTPRALASPQPH